MNREMTTALLCEVEKCAVIRLTAHKHYGAGFNLQLSHQLTSIVREYLLKPNSTSRHVQRLFATDASKLDIRDYNNYVCLMVFQHVFSLKYPTVLCVTDINSWLPPDSSLISPPTQPLRPANLNRIQLRFGLSVMSV